MQHLVDTNDFNDSQLIQIMNDAKAFKTKMPSKILEDKLLITLFFESSTRTRSSFEVAAKRLGASVVHLDPSKSSTNKGESLEDTFENLAAMEPDGVIIRHEFNNTPKKLANKALTPIINAGAGNNAHPTQALLDCFTMMEHFGVDKPEELKGKKLAIVGDIVSSRVASSGIRLFTRLGLDVILVAPKPFMPNNDLPQYEDLNDVIEKVDVIMSLRAQLERHKAPIFEDYNEYANKYCINKERMGNREILLLHPGPVMRNIDISDEMLEDKRSKVLEQVKNGVFVRMAILKLILDN
ncbi:MAG: Aspartate carbamoyltransferase (EC [uncultured Sulfurovum sp.]|uniref:Aspartate carbamoyltransferase n=1 Tax=uncultured Sulfurovum sp. TaxID=269237 RepID=A0A6S6S0C6_9BACT|nr:MAG: Aspartate carbamoyltransferase (EC [uncultured Sulfurovum sp.]